MISEANEAARKLFEAIAEAGRIGIEAFDEFSEMVNSDNADFQEGMEQLSEFFEGEGE